MKEDDIIRKYAGQGTLGQAGIDVGTAIRSAGLGRSPRATAGRLPKSAIRTTWEAQLPHGSWPYQVHDLAGPYHFAAVMPSSKEFGAPSLLHLYAHVAENNPQGLLVGRDPGMPARIRHSWPTPGDVFDQFQEHLVASGKPRIVTTAQPDVGQFAYLCRRSDFCDWWRARMGG